LVINIEENIKLFIEKAEAISAGVHRVTSIIEAKEKFLRDFFKLREEIKQVKQKTIDQMEELAEKFAANATKRGAKVFRAKDAEEACNYVLNLARENGVNLVVKSKSMASEEIHLNKHLDKHTAELVIQVLKN